MMQNRLIFKLQELPSFNPKEKNSFQSKKLIFLNSFIQHIMKDDLLHEMLSDVPFSIVNNLCRYHLSVLSSLIDADDFSYLATYLPWEYRAYHNQGLAYSFFLLAYRHWQSVVEETLDGETAKKVKDIYIWLSHQHEDIIRLSKQKPLFNPDINYTEQHIVFKTMLLEGNHTKALQHCKQFYSEHCCSLNELFDELIHPVMQDIGLMWETGEINSAKEHLATSLITKILSEFYNKQDFITPSRGKAIVTAAPNEYHELGAWIIATALESDGWDVLFLGANTPINDLMGLLKETDANILAISAIVPYNLDDLHKHILEIKNDPSLKHVKIMIGGQAFDEIPNIVHQMNVDAHLHNSTEAIKKAREWSIMK